MRSKNRKEEEEKKELKDVSHDLTAQPMGT